MTKAYQLAIIITIPSDTYEEAKTKGMEIADNLAVDAGIGVALEVDYEHDGSRSNQRVLYLHNEEQPIDLDEEG